MHSAIDISLQRFSEHEDLKGASDTAPRSSKSKRS